MKKATISLFLVLLLSISACSRDNDTETTTLPAISQQTTRIFSLTSTIASSQVSTSAAATAKLPQILFCPEEIKLDDHDFALGPYSSKVPMRGIYFAGFGPLYHILPENPWDSWEYEWEETYNRKSALVPEMLMVYLIKRYKIPKEAFKEAVREEAEFRIRNRYDLSDEKYELPNADILYTFDNEIIDAYYRRENPVAPEWLTFD